MASSTPPGARTTPADVLAIVDLAETTGARLWLDGGWGVDALLGGQTRDDGDLDVAVDARHLDILILSLQGKDFASVDCIAAEWVVRVHDAYVGDVHDRADVRALCDRFGLDVPEQYR